MIVQYQSKHGYEAFNFVFYAEFIHLVSSEANEICNRQLKKTILPEHVFQALQVQ